LKPIIVAPEAEIDLDDITDYISTDNVDRAESFAREILAKFSVIAERPRSFPTKDELHPAMRSAGHGKFRIFFIEYDNHIRIARVLHGARDLPNLL
jgi:toxin ParE1/3/4